MKTANVFNEKVENIFFDFEILPKRKQSLRYCIQFQIIFSRNQNLEFKYWKMIF